MEMNILITGGAGFIGSHLSKEFIKANHSVICVDNFITGAKQNITGLLGHANFKLIEHDISIPLHIKEDLDWVLHFASLASPKYYLEYPIKTLKSGLLGTHNCLGIAKVKRARFLMASTSEIYGDPEVHPQPEEYWGNVNSIGPRSCYDESKRAAEAITYAYMRQHNLDVRLSRIFNIYGPNMQIGDGRVVSNFIVQVLKGNDLTIYGEGNQTRSFCYIDDLVRGIFRLMDVDYKFPLNLGNPAEYKIIDLAKIIMNLIRTKVKIKFLPLPEDDPKRRQPDITKARSILRWQPSVSLEEGLKNTIKYFKKNI